MRRRVAVAVAAVCVAVVVVVLVGGGGGRQAPATPLDDVLGYFPADSALVAAVRTDPKDPQVQALAKATGKLPVLEALVDRFIGRLGLQGISFAEDLKPQLGGPLAVGLEHGRVVIATPVRDAIAVKRLLLGQPELLPRTIVHGRRIWSDATRRRFAAAVDGRVLVAAGSERTVAEALGVRRSAARLREHDFDEALAGLPRPALVRVSLDPRALLAGDRRLRGLLRLPWFDGLRRSGATLRATAHAVTLVFRIRSDAGRLVRSELPLAPGAGRRIPVLGRAAELAFGVRDPDRMLRFADDVVRALEPQRAAAVDHVLQGRGVDLRRDLGARLGDYGDVALDPLTRAWAARVPLLDPGGVRATIAKLADLLPDVAAALGFKGVGVATPDVGENFYALARPSGTSVVFGVVGSAFVAASVPRRAAELVREQARISPARGAIVVSADAQALALRLIAPRLHGLASLGAPFVVGALGQLSGSATIGRGALSGRVVVSLK